MIPVWRLNDPAQNNLGLACTPGGLVLGRTLLIERRDGRFSVRQQSEIELLLSRAYRRPVAADRRMARLNAIASALNANDWCLAHIAAVHLRLPDLPDHAARDAMEATDALIRAVGGAVDQVRKASPDDPKHPGWPAGTPGGRGGKFRPKTDEEISQQTKGRLIRRAARRALRVGFRAMLRVGAEVAANVIPILDIVADAALALDVARAASKIWKLAADSAAALDFVQKGPHSLEEMQVSSSYEEFPDYGDFLKADLLGAIMLKRFGSAGDGFQYHHIVTQGGANATNPDIPPEQLQNTDNIIRLPTLLHEEVNAEYLKPAPDNSAKNPDGSKMNIYQWVQTQPYELQRAYGLKILRDLNILK